MQWLTSCLGYLHPVPRCLLLSSGSSSSTTVCLLKHTLGGSNEWLKYLGLCYPGCLAVVTVWAVNLQMNDPSYCFWLCVCVSIYLCFPNENKWIHINRKAKFLSVQKYGETYMWFFHIHVFYVPLDIPTKAFSCLNALGPPLTSYEILVKLNS